MYVVVDNITLLCNQLFLAAHVIATAREHRQMVVNLGLSRYAHLFPATAQDALCRYPEQSAPWVQPAWAQRKAVAFCRKLGRSLEHGRFKRLPLRAGVVRSGQSSTLDTTQAEAARAEYDLDSAEFRQRFARRRLLFLIGPLHRNVRAMQREAPAIREYFRPSPAVAAAARAAEAGARRRGDVLIGIHIRRGEDYRTFINGRYDYPLEDYTALMARLPDLFPGRRAIFCICSNETQNPATFAGINHVIGPGGVMEDLYTLARCDYVVGPPSTFSAWGSFMGQVPLYFMHYPRHVPALNEFEPNCG